MTFIEARLQKASTGFMKHLEASADPDIRLVGKASKGFTTLWGEAMKPTPCPRKRIFLHPSNPKITVVSIPIKRVPLRHFHRDGH